MSQPSTISTITAEGNRIIWGFMFENTLFTEFEPRNHPIIEAAYRQRKKKHCSHHIIIVDANLPKPGKAKVYFGVAQNHLRMPGTRYYVTRQVIKSNQANMTKTSPPLHSPSLSLPVMTPSPTSTFSTSSFSSVDTSSAVAFQTQQYQSQKQMQKIQPLYHEQYYFPGKPHCKLQQKKHKQKKQGKQQHQQDNQQQQYHTYEQHRKADQLYHQRQQYEQQQKHQVYNSNTIAAVLSDDFSFANLDCNYGASNSTATTCSSYSINSNNTDMTKSNICSTELYEDSNNLSYLAYNRNEKSRNGAESSYNDIVSDFGNTHLFEDPTWINDILSLGESDIHNKNPLSFQQVVSWTSFPSISSQNNNSFNSNIDFSTTNNRSISNPYNYYNYNVM